MEFRKQYWFLSNYCHAPFTDLKTGIKYDTVEHFYQSHKTCDQIERNKIITQNSPGLSKYWGRRCTVRSDWDQVKIDVMKYALELKFNQNPNLKKKLIATGDLKLTEGNTWGDSFWGICNGKGENHLGKLLMDLRTIFLSC